MNVEVRPYFAEGERYPVLIGVRAEGDEYETAYVSKSELVDALTENAKLRELVRDMMRFFEDGDWCDKCNHVRECDSQEQYESDCLMRLVFRDRMRELGVEVD